ncbi:MAG: DUF4347 domain-containing protein, partial [Planctomyces sp.]
VHIISHGASGEILLGHDQLSLNNLPDYVQQIGLWSASLTADADVLFDGCDVAAAPAGQQLLSEIGSAGGFDVAASDDRTGHAGLDGDWDLEFRYGDVETQIPFSESLQTQWVHTLDFLSDFNSSSISTQLNVTGTNSGWTVTQGAVDFFANGYLFLSVPAGGRAVDLNGILTAGRIETALSTVAGHVYDVSFYLGGSGFGTYSVGVEAAGTSASISANMPLFNSFLLMNWQSQTFSFTAVDTSTTLSFESLNLFASDGPLISYLRVTDVTLNGANQPALGTPIITGLTEEDQTLGVDVSGISDFDGLGTFSYRWLRDGAEIAGETNSTYQTSDSDVGHQISVEVSFNDSLGHLEVLRSSVTSSIANVNDAPVGVPSINGVLTENDVLSANVAGISDADGLGTLSYQWLRNGNAISGATNSSYTLGDSDVGRSLSVRVSYTDLNGTVETLTSSVTSSIGNVNDVPVGLPLINGILTEDEILSANVAGISDADGLGTLSYQWLRNGNAISGATNSSYTLGDSDVGRSLSVRVSYTDLNGTVETLTSSVTSSIGNVNDVPVGLPLINGILTEDKVLSANVAGISDADGLGTLSYQWLRNGSAISGATSSSYTLGDSDVGRSLSVRVSYTDLNGTVETLTSSVTSSIANVNDVPVISGPGVQQVDLNHGTGVLDIQVSDIDNPVDSLILSVSSSDAGVIPLSSILLGGSGAQRTVEILPIVSSFSGSVWITLSVTDSIDTSEFQFEVILGAAFNTGFLDQGIPIAVENTGGNSSPEIGGTVNQPDSSAGSDFEDESDFSNTESRGQAFLDDLLSGSASALINHRNDHSDQSEEAELQKEVDQIIQKVVSHSHDLIEETLSDTDTESVADEVNDEALRAYQRLLVSETVPLGEFGAESDDGDAGSVITATELTIGFAEDSTNGPAEGEIPSSAEIVEEVAADEVTKSASSAVMTSVIAVGALTSLGKASAVGAIGTSTTTNSFLNVVARGRLAAARSFETVVGRFATESGSESVRTLVCEQITTSGQSGRTFDTGGTAVSLLASTTPLWWTFDPLVVLDRFAEDYGSHDAAELKSLVSIVQK